MSNGSNVGGSAVRENKSKTGEWYWEHLYSETSLIGPPKISSGPITKVALLPSSLMS